MSNNHTAPVPHRWAEVIHAWADGKEIQFRHTNLPVPADCWVDYSDSTSQYGPWETTKEWEWRIKPEAKTGWINIYPQMLRTKIGLNYDWDYAGVWDTREMADQARRDTCIACIQITYTEGEGL